MSVLYRGATYVRRSVLHVPTQPGWEHIPERHLHVSCLHHRYTQGDWEGSRISKRPTSEEYQLLLQLRTDLRRFLRWSEEQAARAGLTPAQHQLLLAIRGHSDPRGPTIGQVADYLLLRHNSVVGLVDRAEQAGLIRRVGDRQDGRVIRLRLAPRGQRALERLVKASTEELVRLARDFAELANRAGERGRANSRSRPPHRPD